MNQTIQNNLQLLKNSSRGDLANCLKNIKGLKSILLTLNQLALTQGTFNNLVKDSYTLKMSEKDLYEAQTPTFKARYNKSKFKNLLQMLAITDAIWSASFADLTYAEKSKRVKAFERAKKAGRYIHYSHVWVMGDLSTAKFDRIKGHKPLELNYTCVASIFDIETANHVFNQSSGVGDFPRAELVFVTNPVYTIANLINRHHGVMSLVDLSERLQKGNHAKSLKYWQNVIRSFIEYGLLEGIEITSFAKTGLKLDGYRANTKVLRLTEPIDYFARLEAKEPAKEINFDKPCHSNNDNNDIKVTDNMLPF